MHSCAAAVPAAAAVAQHFGHQAVAVCSAAAVRLSRIQSNHQTFTQCQSLWAARVSTNPSANILYHPDGFGAIGNNRDSKSSSLNRHNTYATSTASTFDTAGGGANTTGNCWNTLQARCNCPAVRVSQGTVCFNIAGTGEDKPHAKYSGGWLGWWIRQLTAAKLLEPHQIGELLCSEINCFKPAEVGAHVAMLPPGETYPCSYIVPLCRGHNSKDNNPQCQQSKINPIELKDGTQLVPLRPHKLWCGALIQAVIRLLKHFMSEPSSRGALGVQHVVAASFAEAIDLMPLTSYAIDLVMKTTDYMRTGNGTSPRTERRSKTGATAAAEAIALSTN